MRTLDAPTRWALWTLLVIVPFYSLAAHFGFDDRGYASGLFMGSSGFAARAHWNSRGRSVYWLALIALVIVHIVLVMLLPWPSWKLSGAASMPILLLDFLANLAIIRGTVAAANRRKANLASSARRQI